MSEHKNIILQMSANWCNPCKEAKRYIKSIGAEDKVAYIDVEENEALASEYKIKNVPTFILLGFDGKEVERFIAFDKAKIDRLLEKILKSLSLCFPHRPSKSATLKRGLVVGLFETVQRVHIQSRSSVMTISILNGSSQC